MEIIEKGKKDLPNSTAVLVLGILSLIFCWCYGFIGLILGIIAVVLALPQQKLYANSPDEYSESSYKNMNTGRVCGIIGICIASAIILLLCGIFVMTLGTLGLAGAAACGL